MSEVTPYIHATLSRYKEHNFLTDSINLFHYFIFLPGENYFTSTKKWREYF